MKAAIICVDDEWTILRTLGEQLKRNFGQEYEIELANSGAEALSICAELRAEGLEISLVISDQQMQGMEGDTLLIEIHRLYPKTLKIMLTGEADADSVGNVVNADALYRYIPKPWNETDLILTVAEALRSFDRKQQLAEENALLKEINAKLERSLSLVLATLEAKIESTRTLNRIYRIVSHPVRRPIIMLLMFLGSAGVITVISSLVVIFISSGNPSDWLLRLLILILGVGLLWLIATNHTFNRNLTVMVKSLLRDWRKF